MASYSTANWLFKIAKYFIDEMNKVLDKYIFAENV